MTHDLRLAAALDHAGQPAAASSDQAVDLEIGLIYTYEDHWIEPLLESLSASAPGLRLRLLLVDNASAAGVERWAGHVPQTSVIRNERRRGYGENLNLILQKSRAPYVLLMNTDMLFDPRERCLSKMIEFMNANPQCGLSSPRIYRYDGSYAFPARRFPTWHTAVGRRFGENRFFRGNLDRYFYLDRDPYATMPCDWVTGCFMLVRREAVEKIGVLDEGFRKYFEDVDWCARMTAAGYQVMLAGDTYCFHAEQRASKKIFSVDGRQHLRSYARWIWKYRSGTPQASEASVPQQSLSAKSPPRLPMNGRFDHPPAGIIPPARAA